MKEGGHTIMVVEDDYGIRSTMRMFFEEEGYQVLTAENGKEALEILLEPNPVCLVLLDLFMPVMNGVEVLETIHREAGHPVASIPIIVVSAAPPDGEMAIKAISKAKRFIKKPASLDQLADLTKQYCG
jgi:CheY-like chemotaxis protein